MTVSTGDKAFATPGQDARRTTGLMIGAGLVCLIGAGALLWWREGDRLFTDGLVSALMRCF